MNDDKKYDLAAEDLINRLFEDPVEGFWTLLKTIKSQCTEPVIPNSYIYVIETDTGLVKVGVSMTPDQRIKTLENLGGYFVLRKYISEPCEFANKIENQVHKKLALYRKKGEYFTCPFEMARDVTISSINDLYGEVAK